MSLRDTFLSNNKEKSAVTRGIYKGLFLYWNPRHMIKNEAGEYRSFKAWERNDQQYEDAAILASYLFKTAAIIASGYAASNYPAVVRNVKAVAEPFTEIVNGLAR